MNRRGILLGAGAGLAGILAPGGWAPAAAASGILMPIKRLAVPAPRIVRWIELRDGRQRMFKGIDGDTLNVHGDIALDGVAFPVSATMRMRSGTAYRVHALRVPIYSDITLGPAQIDYDALYIL